MLTLARLTAMYVTGALPVKEKAGRKGGNKGTALAAQSTEWDYESPWDFGHDNFTVRECNEVEGFPYPDKDNFVASFLLMRSQRPYWTQNLPSWTKNLSRR
jgi:hypothetical protein